MKICVIGAGVIGVSTAYMLACAGHDVTVFDQAETVAGGASHGNGAQLSYSYVDPFASPASLKALPGYLVGRDPAVQIRPSLNPGFWLWGLSFMSQSIPSAYARNRKARQKLAALSRSTLADIARALPKEALAPTGSGKIVLAHSDAALKDMANKAATDENLVVLSKSECIAREPALASWQGEWVGGSYAKDDIAIDPVRYCEALKQDCETRYKSQFHFKEAVTKILQKRNHACGVETDKRIFECDRIVVCTGNAANTLLRPHRERLPINPMRGYSLTLPACDTAPKVSITDMKNKIVYANLGRTIRIAGFMDANQKPGHINKRIRQLLETAHTSWPDIADYAAAPNAWSGCRPMVPGGVPVIRQSRVPGLYLNFGHGSLGLTLAAGSASRLAGLMEQETQATVKEGQEAYAT